MSRTSSARPKRSLPPLSYNESELSNRAWGTSAPKKTGSGSGMKKQKKGSVSSSKGKQNPVKILFPSIPFEKPLVGLYFAASWCDDSVAANPAVAKFHETHQDILDIVYVASDQSQKEMDGFAPATFVKIPFENVKERTQLKQHFAVCAAKEREALKIDKRKHGIPTLIVLDSVTGAVITTDGIVDVTETPEKAVEKWSSRTP